MADSKVYDVTIQANNSTVIFGERPTIIIGQQKESVDDKKDAALSIPTVSTLPAKPFHTCSKRSREVEKMKSIFKGLEDGKQTHLTAIYLTGPPGSGKTQLARQFGEQFLEEETNNAERPVVLTIIVESMKTLFKSTKELLDHLHLVKKDTVKEAEEDGEIKVVQLYMEELRKVLRGYSGKWLLILDNMFYKDLHEVLPQPGCENWGDGRIIVTTQNSDLAPVCHQYAKNLSLKCGLDENDAVNLLQEISGIKGDEFAVKLAKELEFLPLSLACAATYVSEMKKDRPSYKFSWEQYHELYQERRGMLKSRTFEAYNVYRHSMVVAARLATSHLAEYSDVLRHAFDFLSYCTTSPVPLIIVSKFVQELIPSDRISDEILAEISRCSLLSLPDVSSSFSTVETIKFHQVMGEAFEYVREERASSSQNVDAEQRRMEYVSLLHSLQKTLEKAMPGHDHGSVALKILASPHLKAIIDFGKAKNWTDCSEFVVIVAFLADCLYHVPGVTESERISYCELANEIALRLSKPMQSIQYCRLLKSLGFYYREANYLDKAVVILEKGLHLTENKESKEWVVLKSALLSVLSWTFKMQTKYDQAEQAMKDSIDLAKKSFGTNHQVIVGRLCDFAIIYREKQDIEKAKEIVDQARQMAEITTDSLHLARAQAANYSAKIYLRYAEIIDNPERKKTLLYDSLKLHADALGIYENVLGKEHIYVAGVCMTYGTVYKELNDNTRALEFVKRAEKIYRDVEHVQLSSALRYKTEVLLALGDANEAEKAIKGSIEIDNCGRARFLLGDVYLHQRKYLQARDVIEEVLARWKSGVLPPTHFWVKHAEKIKQECDRQIRFKIFLRFFPVVVLIVAMLLGVWYSW